MTEQEILEAVKKSAEKTDIPQSLEPEAVKRMLDRKVEEMPSIHDDGEAGIGNDRKSKYIRTKTWKKIAAAAAVLVIGIFSIEGLQLHQNQETADDVVIQNATDLSAEIKMEENTASEATEEKEWKAPEVEPKQDAGSLYTVASGYEEVYDLLDQYQGIDRYYGYITDLADGLPQSLQKNSAFNDSDSGQGMSYASVQESSKEIAAPEESAEVDYSTTNLQTAGVDESDIIKTNGNYIFTISQNKVLITDVRSDQIKKAGEIIPETGSAADYILEMYVDDRYLVLILQHYESVLREKYPLEQESPDAACYIEPKSSIIMYTYDISSPETPRLTGKVTQDGNYKTSRKIGDIVYLFTTQSLWNVTSYVTEGSRSSGGFLPLVNGEEFSYDCIYLPEQGSTGLMVSSVSLEHPESVYDKIMIIHDAVQIYASTEAFYLYYTDDQDDQTMTQIAKFTIHDGVMNAAGAVSVKGEIRDTFAINESQGKLRVLTTGWDSGDGKDTNSLYLFDEKLELTGTLSGIAEGERIYAARYLGDMAYFITYRNTDPLFVVDLSDERNPVILGELEVTGFSEYLHPWGEDRLLGIGYETDPETGIQKGIKLVMFDISNPIELKEIDSIVIENAGYSAALYNYKCVLAEKNANIIGFTVDNCGEYGRVGGYVASYLLFSWEGNQFRSLLTEALGDEYGSCDYRGIYIGDRFYIASPETITSFDRKNSYRQLEQLVFVD